MTDERFNDLLNGPLRHPLPMFTMSRLEIALRAATGEAGEGRRRWKNIAQAGRSRTRRKL
jgi:hypothetical protein